MGKDVSEEAGEFSAPNGHKVFLFDNRKALVVGGRDIGEWKKDHQGVAEQFNIRVPTFNGPGGAFPVELDHVGTVGH
jgi:hypothetical protein